MRKLCKLLAWLLVCLFPPSSLPSSWPNTAQNTYKRVDVDTKYPIRPTAVAVAVAVPYRKDPPEEEKPPGCWVQQSLWHIYPPSPKESSKWGPGDKFAMSDRFDKSSKLRTRGEGEFCIVLSPPELPWYSESAFSLRFFSYKKGTRIKSQYFSLIFVHNALISGPRTRAVFFPIVLGWNQSRNHKNNSSFFIIVISFFVLKIIKIDYDWHAQVETTSFSLLSSIPLSSSSRYMVLSLLSYKQPRSGVLRGNVVVA